MQRACAMLSSVACPAVQYLSETFLMLSRIKRDMIENVYWPSCKVSLDLNET
jgi:hypothetical protein